MFDHFPQSDIEIVAPDGTVRQRTKALIDSKQITIPDSAALVMVGDEIRRKIPNGTEEAFEVVESMFREAFHGIPARHLIKFRRKGTFPKGTGGNYTFHVTGPNARVNFHSTDNSANSVGSSPIFGEMKRAVTESAINNAEKERLRQVISTMESRLSDPDGYRAAYQDFMVTAAAHMTVVAPFLPALAKLLS